MKLKKRKRNEKRKPKNFSKSLKIFAANAAGIKCKLKSLNGILLKFQPQIWMLEETKLKPNEKIKCEAAKDFQIFYLNRQDSQGGGLALGIQKDIECALVREGDDDIEALSVQTVLGGIPVRIIIGYGPQENADIKKKNNFWSFVENEIHEAELEDHGIIFQMDGNLHAGHNLVKGDPNPQNRNGKMFMDFLARNNSLVVLNCLDKCKGVITRRRVLESRIEEAVLDFCLINDKMRPFFKEMIIDEDRNFCLSNVAQIKKNGRIVQSDHNAFIIDFDIKIEARKPVREEMFNFKNKHCQAAFREATEHNEELVMCFNNKLPFEEQSRKWKKTFNSVLHKCFKKVRIVSKKIKEEEKLRTFEMLKERAKMVKDLKDVEITEEMRDKIEERIKQIEAEIEKEFSEECIKDVLETVRELGEEENSIDGRKCGKC